MADIDEQKLFSPIIKIIYSLLKVYTILSKKIIIN